jgi:SpoVK/Ycf46/Vps4 family AAA+-type ATPase
MGEELGISQPRNSTSLGDKESMEDLDSFSALKRISDSLKVQSGGGQGGKRSLLSTQPASAQEDSSKRFPGNRFDNERGNHALEDDDFIPPRLVVIRKPKVRFSDIGGLTDVKEKLKLEVIYQRLRPDLYRLYNKYEAANVLLWGPPGCGKTMIAKAVATEVDSPFVAPKISEIMTRWLGESEKMISQLFKAPTMLGTDSVIVFLDEFDALVPRGGPSYVQRMKNQFLTELDGVESRPKGLMILAATNRPFIIDSAVRRPGRFEKTVFIPPPDRLARQQIFEMCLGPLSRSNVMSEDVMVAELAERTEGYSGADIKSICDSARDEALEAALRAGKQKQVTMEGLERMIGRTPKSIIPWINESIRTARRYNELGYYPELMELAEGMR